MGGHVGPKIGQAILARPRGGALIKVNFFDLAFGRDQANSTQSHRDRPRLARLPLGEFRQLGLLLREQPFDSRPRLFIERGLQQLAVVLDVELDNPTWTCELVAHDPALCGYAEYGDLSRLSLPQRQRRI
jgi:hypothetical protein